MPATKLEQFGGMLPAWDQHLLPTGQAALSINGYLFSGALEGWRQPKKLRDLQNPAARFAYRIPTISETQALAYLVFLTQPNAGDTITIGETTYDWVTVLSDPGDVLIGADILTSATNLRAAITTDNGDRGNDGILYGLHTIANTDVKWYTATQNAVDGLAAPVIGLVNIGGSNYTYLSVGSTDFGSSFNNIPVSESSGNLRTTWLQDLLSFSDTAATFTGGSNPSFTNQITAPSAWLEFNDQDTNVVKSQVVDDEFKRYYFASPSQEPKYNTYARIAAGLPPWLLGVPPPGCAPGVTVAGGGNNLTLGNYTAGGGQYVGQSNFIYLIPVTPTGATVIQDVKIAPGPNTALDINAHVAAVIYEDNNGAPGTLLNTGQIINGISDTNVTESAFVNPTSLLANTTYWIGFMIDTVATWSASFGSNANMVGFSNTFSNGPPATADAVTTGLLGINMWGDFVSSDVIEARAYVYTWVSAYKEEGPPSPSTLVDGWSNGVWTVTLWTPPLDEMGVTRDITSLNLYRTVVGTGGSTVFFFVANIPIGTLTYSDSAADSVVSLNNQLPSATWFPPPENLQGLLAMPNGVLAGFVNNEVWFCEPYFPHAWPPGFVLTVDFPIVGLGLTNGGLVVCTGATPSVITGNTPGTMTEAKCSEPNPCNSRASILSGDAAVSYLSPNGMIQVKSDGSAVNTTDLWFTRERWQELTPPRYGRCIYLASCYFVMGSTSPASVVPADNSQAQRGFTIELNQDNTSFTIWPQPGGHRLGFNELTSPNGFDIDNVLTDPWTGIGMLVQNAAVYYYDFSDPQPTMVPYTWTSKIYQQNNKKSYAAMKAFFTVPAGTADQVEIVDAEASDPVWATLGANQYAVIKTFVDVDGTGNMVLIDCREIRKSGGLLRIIDGFKAEQWQWQITGRVKISNVQIAATAKELANV